MKINKSGIFREIHNSHHISNVNTSSQGVYLKYDILENGIKYLIKTGRLIGRYFSLLEPVSECMAYDIAKCLGVPCAEYILDTADILYNGILYKDVVVCKSRWFLGEDDEFNSARSLYLNTKRSDLYNSIISDYPSQRLNIDNMIVFDFIINNTDRHLRNFGFISKGLLAPLYDNGLSLGADMEDIIFLEEDIEDLLLDCDYNKCFYTCNREQLTLVKTHSLNIDILYKEYKTIVLKYKKYLKPERLEFILRLLEERISYVRKIQFSKER